MAFDIQFGPDCEDHLGALTAHQRARVLDEINEQLTHQPNVPTRNRKPMGPNDLATWELRVGTIRVYYDMQEQPQPTVAIRAVGVKRGSRVFILDEEVQW